METTLEILQKREQKFADAAASQTLAKAGLASAVAELDNATAEVKRAKAERNHAREAHDLAMGKRTKPRKQATA